MTRSTPSRRKRSPTDGCASPLRVLAGAVALSAILLGGFGGGSAARADDVEEAKRHFARAETAYKLSQFKVAIEEYEAAYKAMPDPAFLFNIAQAQRQQYYIDKDAAHLQRALALYKSYLRETQEPRNRVTVEKIIEEMKSILSAVEDRARPGKKQGKIVLRGEASIAGASVELDGKPLGTIPVSGSVEPGSHLIKVSKEGFRPWSTSVNISAGAEVEIPVTLQSTSAGSEGGGRVEKDEPLYKKWWFWTIIGGVALAGAGAGIGIYFATRGESVTSMPEIDLR
jgi:tetratricopeptide (TPR) repeat protein